MHNSVVFYRKAHNFSFYPIIHKKVLIFAKRSPRKEDGLFVLSASVYCTMHSRPREKTRFTVMFPLNTTKSAS